MKKFLIFIFIFSLILRIYNLNKIPLGPDGDEAAFGYYGYSLLVNQSDEYGNKFPLYFSSIGDYKYPVYAYLTTLSVLAFGLNAFSARFVSALFGSFLVIIMYLLAMEVFKNKKVAIFACLIAAISPYGIMFSRGAYESNLAMVLLAIGILLYLKEKLRLSGVFFLLALFTYSPVRLFLVLFLVIVNVFNLKRNLWLGFLIILIVIAASLNVESRARASGLIIVNSKVVLSELENLIHDDGMMETGNIGLTRVFHNKIVVNGVYIFGNYLSHFDPKYLFVESNPEMSKYSTPGVGLFYFFEVVTMYLGLMMFYGKKDCKKRWIIGVWLLVSVIPSALTVETPNPIRMLIGLPAWILISAYGTWRIFALSKKYKKVLYPIIVGIILLNVTYFIHQYFVHEKFDNPQLSDNGVKELVQLVTANDNYEKVFIPDDPYIFFLFYNKVNPEEFIENAEVTDEQVGQWERVKRFGNIYFNMPQECPQEGDPDVLYVCKGPDMPRFGKIQEKIKRTDGVVAFYLVHYN